MDSAEITNQIIANIDHDKTFCWHAKSYDKFFDPNVFVHEHSNKANPQDIFLTLVEAGFKAVEFSSLDRGDLVIIVNGRSILHGLLVKVEANGDQHIDLQSDWSYCNDAGLMKFDRGVRILNPFQKSEIEKPPLGVVPEWIILQNRNKAILNSLSNYNDRRWHSVAVQSMLDEFNSNLKRLQELKHSD